jgi:hypothetical protein
VVYAQDTTTAVDKSQAEIRRALEKAKADRVSFGWPDDHTEAVVFRIDGDFYQIRIPHPPLAEPKYGTGAGRDKELVDRFHRQYTKTWANYRKQEIMRRWRVALLLVKSRIELVREGVEVPAEAFLRFLMLPDGGQLGERVIEQMPIMRQTGQTPTLLPALPAGDEPVEGTYRELTA